MRRQIIERGATIGVEVRDRSSRGILKPACTPVVVKRNDQAMRLDAVIDFRRGDHKTVPGEAHTRAYRRTRQLKDVRITDDAGIAALRLRRGNEGSHRTAIYRDVYVIACKYHIFLAF